MAVLSESVINSLNLVGLECLRNTVYCPSYQQNIFSVKKITGYDCELGLQTCHIQVLIASGHMGYIATIAEVRFTCGLIVTAKATKQSPAPTSVSPMLTQDPSGHSRSRRLFRKRDERFHESYTIHLPGMKDCGNASNTNCEIVPAALQCVQYANMQQSPTA